MDWYQVIGTHPVSGLALVQLWDIDETLSHFALLRNLYRQGCVLWPEDGNFDDIDYKNPHRIWTAVIYHNSVEVQDAV